MDAALWERVKAVFAETVEHPPEARSAVLDRACDGDRTLRREVEALLAADTADRALGVEDRLVRDAREPDDALTGQAVGPYRIEGEIGRGGMGAVYRATRADGAFDKTVALKLVKRGMDTDEVLARFRRERQVLASLEHPGIARLLDGGAAADGRPYLVMEYVVGEPITDYCDRHALDVDARLVLFERICEAVQHAHQHFVVHRDLKPSNILVTADGGADGGSSVKLLDFGIAKLLDPEAAGLSVLATRTDARLLTPAYAAPEQLAGGTITTATDVYALGALLYELLAEQRPHDLTGKTAVEAERTLREEEPARPSLVAPAPRRGRLRGDLDAICLKALRAEPQRRYASVEALRADVQRHRRGLPIAARPETVGYRVRTFVRRHRVGVAAAALVALSLVGGLGAALWQARAAAQERDRATTEARRAERTTDLLVGLFDTSARASRRADTLTAPALIRRAVEQIEAFENDPAMQAELHEIVGRLYYHLSEYAAARRYLQEAVTRLEALYGPDDPRVADALFSLAAVHHAVGVHRHADSLYTRWEALVARTPPSQEERYADRLVSLGQYRSYGSDPARAEPHLRRAIAIYERLFGGRQHPQIAQAQIRLAHVYSRLGDDAQAEALLREATDTFRTLAQEAGEPTGGLFADYGPALSVLGRTLQAQGRPAEALPILHEALGATSEHDPLTATLMRNLGRAYRGVGRYDEAEDNLRGAVERLRAQYGLASLMTLATQVDLGDLYRRQGRFAEAESLLLESHGHFAARAGEERYRRFRAQTAERLVQLYEAWGRPEQADRYRVPRQSLPARE